MERREYEVEGDQLSAFVETIQERIGDYRQSSFERVSGENCDVFVVGLNRGQGPRDYREVTVVVDWLGAKTCRVTLITDVEHKVVSILGSDVSQPMRQLGGLVEAVARELGQTTRRLDE
jgi:nucleosome binding factor SPN SPT16 subunit